ncbi:MAG: molybdate ABC transporter substrate-binding protein [Anaerolineae bacterium]
MPFARTLSCLAGLLLVVACAGSAATSTPRIVRGNDLLVAAAADLQFALTDIGQLFEQQTGRHVIFSFGSTGNLTTQIENGAPFDLFAAANVDYIDRLRDRGLVIPDTQQLYGQGRIVLSVNRKAGATAATLGDLLDPSIHRVAIANPDHAPYGLAAKQALQHAGVWDGLQPKLVYGENVRQTLQFVQTGNAPAGIVALSIADVPEISWTLIDADLHEPLNQALAVIRGSPNEQAARAFIEFVNGPQGRPIMKQYGFLLPGEF